MNPSPFHHTISRLLAESLKATAKEPTPSGESFMPSQSRSFAQIQAIAREGLAEALLKQVRRRGPRIGLWKAVNLDRAFPAIHPSRPGNSVHSKPAAWPEIQPSAGKS